MSRGVVGNVAPLLLRPGSARDGRGLLSVLTVAAFAVTHLLLLAVVGGLLMFVQRGAHPLTQLESDAGPAYVMLAAFATVLLAVPLASLAAAAARLGATRRERRLAGLRLLGATPAHVTAWATLEVLQHAAAGIVVGSILFGATLPLWHALSFQGRRIGYAELAPSPLSLLAVSAGVVLLALASTLTGLRRVRITPLGVARRSRVPEVHVARLVGVGVLLLVWIVAGGALGQLGTAVATGITLAFVAALMAGVNAAGPYFVQLLGRILARTARGPARLLAGRRLVADPQAGWRAIGALGLASFVAGCTVLMPALASGGDNPDEVVFLHDIGSGALLTLAIAFAITAASTGIAQAAGVLERADDARTLALTGAPVTLHDAARRWEVLAPVATAVLPGLGAALAFQLPLVGAQGLLQAGSGLALLGASLVLGVGVVAAAEEACGPLQRRVIAERARKAD